ncbi:hypothetical protein CLU79DRAFT_553428 [Phycomyces nitens]|nr:hypothetical protein CLU79DRAFT_553428 [Phycomyces nitens]
MTSSNDQDTPFKLSSPFAFLFPRHEPQTLYRSLWSIVPFKTIFLGHFAHNSDMPLATRLIPGSPNKFSPNDVAHDKKHRMFTIVLNEAGLLAALCYLPTQYPTIVEFYHVEIPVAYRHQAIGDLLVATALCWAVDDGYQVTPTCEFVRLHLENKYIRTHKALPACIKAARFK